MSEDLTPEQVQFRQDMQQHVEECAIRFAEGDVKFREFIESQQKNTEALILLATDVKDGVQFLKDVQGVVRLGKKVQAFGVWLSKWPLIGGGVFLAYSWIIENLPSN